MSEKEQHIGATEVAIIVLVVFIIGGVMGALAIHWGIEEATRHSMVEARK